MCQGLTFHRRTAIKVVAQHDLSARNEGHFFFALGKFHNLSFLSRPDIDSRESVVSSCRRASERPPNPCLANRSPVTLLR